MPEVIGYLKHERRHNSSLIVDPTVLAMYLQMQWHRVSLVDGGREQSIWSEVELLASRLWQMDATTTSAMHRRVGDGGARGRHGWLSTSGCSRSSITLENVILRISAPVQFPSATSRSR